MWWKCRDSGDTIPCGSGAVDQWLLSSTCHSSVYLQLMYICTGKNQACSGRGHLFELQAAVEWKAVESRGADERTLMNSTAIFLATCENLTSRNLVDQGMALTTTGTEPQQRERAAGVKSLCSTLAEKTSGRAKWLTGTEWSQLEASVNALARQRTSNQNLEDKWMKWVKLVRSVGGYDICAQRAASKVARDCVP